MSKKRFAYIGTAVVFALLVTALALSGCQRCPECVTLQSLSHMSGPLDITAAATEGAPGLYFAGDSDTGLYSAAANQLGLSTGGTERLNLSSSGLSFSGGFAATLGAAEKVLVDGATTAQTNTAGSVDINGESITANYSPLNVSSTQNNGAATGTDQYAAVFTMTGNDADGDNRGISITASNTGVEAAGSYEYGLSYACAVTVAGGCTDGAVFTSAGVASGLTDAVDASAANIDNALNVGPNDIMFEDDTVDMDVDDTFRVTRNDSGEVTYTCADNDANATCIYDSGGSGDTQLGSADTSKATVYATDDLTLDLTSGAAGEDLIISQDGNNDSGILISAEGSGTDAVKIETITNNGDIVVSSVDNVQITSSSAAGLIDIDGTAGLVYSIGEDDTAADTIVMGSAKDNVDFGAD